MLVAQGRPIFYISKRIGLDRAPFQFLKFRTMVPNAESLKKTVPNKHGDDHVLFKSSDDPRITKVGKFLRRCSLDELPQFINVLKGEMSVVGPRPALPEEVERYSDLVSRRLQVKPGITGPWQVSGRSDLTWDKSLLLDLNYPVNWSLWGDFWIIFRTVAVMLTGKGAY
ncbi:MAG: sugar transferase [Actinomycetota bacterium]